MEKLAQIYKCEESSDIHAMIAEKRCHAYKILLTLIALINFQHGIHFRTYSEY